MYNETMCRKQYERLPFCLEAIQLSYMSDTVEAKRHAIDTCKPLYERIEGRNLENMNDKVRLKAS
jgi:hypothetical protein